MFLLSSDVVVNQKVPRLFFAGNLCDTAFTNAVSVSVRSLMREEKGSFGEAL